MFATNLRHRPMHCLLVIALTAPVGCNQDAAAPVTPEATVSDASTTADALAEMMRRSKRQYGSVEGIVEELAAADVPAIIKGSNLGSLRYSEAEYRQLDPRQREQITEEMDALNRFFKAVGRRGVELAAEARRDGNSPLATRYVRMLERAGLTLQDRKRMAFIRDIGESLSRAAKEAAR